MNASRLTAALLLVASSALQPIASAEDPDGLPIGSPEVTQEWQPTSTGRLHRAGCPTSIAPWARFTYGRKYCCYFVGGGAALYGRPPSLLRGEPRYAEEGTWGVDYDPWYSRVRLQWFHGRRKQDGEGHYEPDHKNNPLIPLIFR